MPGQNLIGFDRALRDTEHGRRYLLLGNGFSIALFPDRFRYGSLLQESERTGLFNDIPEALRAFTSLSTTDFEVVINALRQTVALLPLYSADGGALVKMRRHADALIELLVQAIASRHPERPSDVSEEQYAACRAFLGHFVGKSRIHQVAGKTKDNRGKIYTGNYDLLLYWTLLHDQVVRWDADNPVASFDEQTDALEHDDGFRAPDDDPDAPYVTWDAEGAADQQTIHYLHGALHLFDYGAELQKRCWERSGGIPLIDQIRSALAEGRFPLFVAEGDSDGKLARIRHSGYLQRSLKSFAGVCKTQQASLFIFGHSLAENDKHIHRLIERGKFGKLYVSLHGDPTNESNREIIVRARRVAAGRHERFPLEVAFFDATEARVWG